MKFILKTTIKKTHNFMIQNKKIKQKSGLLYPTYMNPLKNEE